VAHLDDFQAHLFERAHSVRKPSKGSTSGECSTI
jgi:hypothetical protein